MKIKKHSSSRNNKHHNTKKSLKSRLPRIEHPYIIRTDVGLEDPQGLNNNPLTGKPFQNLYVNDKSIGLSGNTPRTYANISTIWTKKIVYTNRQLLYDAISKSQIILATAGTGVGKTILIPRIAMHAFDYKEKVICCCPKRLPTQNNASFVAKCMDVKIGEEVGYCYQGTNLTNKNGVETKLTFMTTGSLLSRLTGSDPMLADYKCIIVDEAHERSVQTDQLLLLIKKLCLKRRDLKVIIMSATVSLQTFRDYFPSSQFRFGEVDMGSELSFHVSEKWLDKPPVDWKKTAIDITMNILKMTSTGDILIFCKSGGDANQLCILLDKMMADFRKKIAAKTKSMTKKSSISSKKSKTQKNQNTTKSGSLIIPREYQINPLCIKLEGASSALDQRIATDAEYYKTLKDSNGYPYTRKVICSTNVAESSITVEGIVFVIDSGYEYTDSYDPNGRIRCLLENKIAQSACVQRKGRAGRTQAGYCFHLYTEKEQKSFQEYPTPSIEKSDITNDILDLMRLPEANTVSKVRNLLDEFISPPHEKFILNSLRTLHALGAITNIQDTGTITHLGFAISRFRAIKANHARALIASHFYGVSRSVCDIIALLSITDGMVETIFQEYRPDKKKSPEHNKKEMQKWISIMKAFSHPLGDHMTLLKAYKMYMKVADKTPIDDILISPTADDLGTDVDVPILEAINEMDEIEEPDAVKQPPSLRKWCREHYINANRMAKVRRTSRQLYDTLRLIMRPVINKNNKHHDSDKHHKSKHLQSMDAVDDIDKTMSELDVSITRESIKAQNRYSNKEESVDNELDSDLNHQDGGYLQRIKQQELMDKLEQNVKRFPNEDENIMMALAIGNFVNFAIRSKQADNVYVSCFAQNKKFAKINQDSFLVAHNNSKLPKLLMFDEMFQSNQEARLMKMNIVSKIPDNVFTRIKELFGAHIKYCL